eukprot:scaffold99755_cov62-Attheya_sp.AAC.4
MTAAHQTRATVLATAAAAIPSSKRTHTAAFDPISPVCLISTPIRIVPAPHGSTRPPPNRDASVNHSLEVASSLILYWLSVDSGLGGAETAFATSGFLPPLSS